MKMINILNNINASCIIVLLVLCSAYKYLSTAPDVKVTEYLCVTVEANLQNCKGRGSPRFYQLQYKVSSEFSEMP